MEYYDAVIEHVKQAYLPDQTQVQPQQQTLQQSQQQEQQQQQKNVASEFAKDTRTQRSGPAKQSAQQSKGKSVRGSQPQTISKQENSRNGRERSQRESRKGNRKDERGSSKLLKDSALFPFVLPPEHVLQREGNLGRVQFPVPQLQFTDNVHSSSIGKVSFIGLFFNFSIDPHRAR